jgi:hypothetical protein
MSELEILEYGLDKTSRVLISGAVLNFDELLAFAVAILGTTFLKETFGESLEFIET